METVLKRLFDYQKFENNQALQEVTDSVHARYAVRELDLDEMSFAAAAGTPDSLKKEDFRDAAGRRENGLR